MSDTGSTEPMASRPGDATAGRPGAPMAGPASSGATAARAGDDLHVEPAPGQDDHRLGGTSRQRRDRDRTDPVEAAKDPDTRAKLLLATAALTLLTTVLLIAILVNVLGDAGEQVVVDGVSCIVADGGEEQTLYCQR
jgi:hypothetical protein